MRYDMINETIHPFQKESGFELALCDVLTQHGWEKDILVQASEEDLVENWAQIIFDNNRELERLGNYPLTTTEMQQIIDQVNTWHSPYADETRQDYDELLIERNKGGRYWLHFAVRPKDNRRKTRFIQT